MLTTLSVVAGPNYRHLKCDRCGNAEDMFLRRLKVKTLFLAVLSWLPLFLLYMRLSKDLKIKESYRKRYVDEERLNLYFDQFQHTTDKNITVLASYDRTPWKKSLLPGQNGEGVVIPFYRMKEEKAGYELHAFNSVASDIIPLERRLKDYRKAE